MTRCSACKARCCTVYAARAYCTHPGLLITGACCIHPSLLIAGARCTHPSLPIHPQHLHAPKCTYALPMLVHSPWPYAPPPAPAAPLPSPRWQHALPPPLLQPALVPVLARLPPGGHHTHGAMHAKKCT